MKKSVIIAAVFSIIILFISSASALFTKGNLTSSIETTYSPGEKLRGWINISLRNEPGDSLLASNLGGGIKLRNFLEDNAAEFSCVPSNCESDFNLSNAQNTKSFELNSGQEKIVSLKILEKVSSVDSFSFNLSVENNLGCSNPLEMSIMPGDENEIIWKSNVFSDEFSCIYSGGRGCFNIAESLTEKNITNKAFCEKITLVQSSKYKIGAWVRKGNIPSLLTMKLYELDGGNALASCNLPDASTSGGEVECTIYYNTSDTRDYYVCIEANRSDSDYATKMESVNPCGFFHSQTIPPPASQDKFDYFIFAKAAKFGRIGSVRFNQADMKNNIMNYLIDRYAPGCTESCSVNCTGGCAVPIKFKAYGGLNASVSNLVLSYTTDSGISSNNDFYDASVVNGKVSSGFLKLDLEFANISVHSGYGNQTITLSLGNQEIASKQINIAKIPVIRNILPKSVPAAVLTKFSADVYSPSNKSIVKYLWDFGDGDDEETSVNFVMHSYSATGTYTLTLEVEDSSGFKASKEFSVIAGNPKDVLNSTLKKYRQRINNITNKIESEPEWLKTILKEVIDLENLNSDLIVFEKKFALASTDEEYTSIMSNLSEMSVPVSISKSQIMNFPVLIDSESANLDYLTDIGAGENENGTDSEVYSEAILKWYDENIGANMDFYTYSVNDGNGVRLLLTYYKMKITAKNPSDDENYLIINELASVNSDLFIKEFGDAVGVKFTGLENREIEFAVEGEKNPLEISLYMSPEFRNLDLNLVVGVCNNNKRCDKDLGENSKNCRSDCKPWGWTVFYLVLLLFLSFMGYLGLQWWYQRRYENYLFKNRNDLYNLVNFINNSLIRGMKKEEIVKNLKQSGWHSEQIDYAFKKVKGKKTGLPLEIGIPKIGLKKQR